MFNREVKRYGEKAGKILEPFAIIALLFIFTVPVLTVLNLTPKFKQPQANLGENVLGTTDSQTFEITQIQGRHQIVQNEFFNRNEIGYTFGASLKAREEGNFSKPILQITNSSNKDIEITLAPKTALTNSKIGLLYNEKNYIILDEKGIPYSYKITIPQGTAGTIYLTVSNETTVSFDTDFSVDLIVK